MNLKQSSVEDILDALERIGYFASVELALAIKNAAILNKPILIEGPPGVGKTELAKALAKLQESVMIRLQCTPEMNEGKAIYDFDYAKQLLFLQILKDDIFDGQITMSLEEKISYLNQNNPFYSEEFLVKRPVFQAFNSENVNGSVLLIDELDKADEEFEYSLLEPFSDYSISIPEIGTIEALHKPLVIITSNRRRKITDTLLRRCLYLYVSYPTIEEETRIILSKVKIEKDLALEVTKMVARIRKGKLAQYPSIAESIEWALVLSTHSQEQQVTIKKLMLDNLSVIAKNPSDREKIKEIISPSTDNEIATDMELNQQTNSKVYA